MSNQEISEVVRQLVEVVRDLAQTRPNPMHDQAGEMFKKIAQSKPPLYSGEIEPSVLEN